MSTISTECDISIVALCRECDASIVSRECDISIVVVCIEGDVVSQ
jgi:hypothetical protein